MSGWIEFIVMKNLPIMIVDCPYTRKMCKPKPISSKSLRFHIMSLTGLLKERVKEFLPDKFVLVFDGWTEGTQHYIGVSASYSSVLKKVPRSLIKAPGPGTWSLLEKSLLTKSKTCIIGSKFYFYFLAVS